MLANPARELLRVFEGWSQSSSSVARFARPLDTEEEIAQALHAALLLRDIQRLVKVAEVERPEHNLSWASKYYARWAHAIFQYPHGWDSSFHLESYELDVLSALAGTFDAITSSSEPGLLDWISSKREEMASKVREVADYVADDKGLSSSFRAYIHEVMCRVEAAFSDELSGSFSLYNAYMEFTVLVDAVSIRSTDPEAKAFYRSAWDWLQVSENARALAWAAARKAIGL